MALGARAFDLLLTLVERRERVVARRELLDIVWSGLVVDANNMAVQVSTLRKLLGVHAIATVPGRGYRFAVPLDDEPIAPPSEQVSTPPAAKIAPLPARSELLGRDSELAALVQLLRRHRIVSVVGPAGIGKTTLALAAAHRGASQWRDGALWVDLASVNDGPGAARLLAQACQLPLPGREDAPSHLAQQLRQFEMLMVLDNAEHVVDAVACIAHAIAQSAAGVQLLLTSQLPLKVDGERLFRLDALAVPPAGTPLAEARTQGAVALFVEQAQAVDRSFALTPANLVGVIALCRRLDGLPLAIKLAARRLPLFGVDGLNERLSERFTWLAGGVRGTPPRQQTLRASLDWSHDLLNEPEQALFRRLGVFVGGFALDLAAGVAGEADEIGVMDRLESLIDRSLVAVDAGEPPRYRLLESPRAYALLKLEEAYELEATRERHARSLLAFFERIGGRFWESSDAEWISNHGGEIDNVRAALDWSAQHDRRLALALLGATTDLFISLSLHHECRERYEALDDVPDDELVPAATATRCLQRARLLFSVAELRARKLAVRAAELFRTVGDDCGRYLALNYVALSSVCAIDEARRMIDEMRCIERRDCPARLRRLRLVTEGAVLLREGKPEEAAPLFEAALALARQAGAVAGMATDRSNLVHVYLARGRYEEAVLLGRELAESQRGRSGRTRVYPLGNFANALLLAGNGAAEARKIVEELCDVSRAAAWDGFPYFSDVYALLAAAEGRADVAARLIGYADKTYELIGSRYPNAL